MTTTLRTCPQCKRGDIVERRNKRTGQPFYGCTRYPDCKFAVADLARLAPSALGASSGLASTETVPSGDYPGNVELVSAMRELSHAIAALTNQRGSRNASQEREPRDQSGFSSSISQEQSHD